MSTVDDSKVNYYSGWDIDQLVASNKVVVPSGTSLVVAIPAGLPAVPNYEVQFQLSGFSRWYQAGAFSTDGTLANVHSFNSYVSGGNIYINTTTAGTAKYFIWSDKVDH